jgi:hypothetical protein
MLPLWRSTEQRGRSVDWKREVDRAGTSISDIKQRLPLQYVVASAGVALDPKDGRLVGLCPFHPDTDPSFAIFGDDLDRCGCWSCDFGTGDHLDFIGRWKSLDLQGSLAVALDLLAEYEGLGGVWEPLKVEPSEPVDPAVLLEQSRSAWNSFHIDKSAVEHLLDMKDLKIDPDWLNQEWRVGVLDGTTVYIPHFDGNGVVTGAKTRFLNQHPYAVRGSSFVNLYGVWRGIKKTVVLCEGESDTWWVSWVLRNRNGVTVLGLPSGVSARVGDAWVGLLRDKDVVLLFDGDESGREGARKWHDVLVGVASSVQVAVVGDGQDAAELGEEELLDVLGSASSATVLGVTVVESPVGYVRPSNGTMVANWIARPRKFLNFAHGGSGEYGFELERYGVISSSDFATETSIRKWANSRQLQWWGGVKDAQSILHMLMAQKPFLLQQKATRKVGWHDGVFIWVDGSIGREKWVYAGSEVSGPFRTFVTLGDPEGDVGQMLGHLVRMNRRDVMTPIMGWLVAALMRPDFAVFPPLAVVGTSGGGKTSILQAVLGAFGFGGGEHNLTGTTGYGCSMLVAGSCGVPVWFDEYNPGAKKDALVAVEQILRDAWTGSSSLRGGVGQNYSNVVALEASGPVIVSGEDTFSATSLLERVILVRVSQDEADKNPDELAAVLRGGQIGTQLLEWLVAHGERGGAVDGLSRPEIGRRTVEWGWNLLRRFGVEVGGVDIGEIELEGVRKRSETALALHLYLELLLWGLDETDASFKPLVWPVGDDLCVRPRALLSAARKEDWTLPGGERALGDWVLERWGGFKVKTNHGLALQLEGGYRELSGVLDKIKSLSSGNGGETD